jgi:hypothetical protein
MDWLGDLGIQVALDWNRRLMHQPPGASCSRCGVRNPMVLVLPILSKKEGRKRRKRRKRPLLCYRCRVQDLGRSGIERQHLGGRPSPLPLVPIDANLHRVLTYLQHVWRRAGLAPGSQAAVLFDVITLAVLWARWEPRDVKG